MVRLHLRVGLESYSGCPSSDNLLRSDRHSCIRGSEPGSRRQLEWRLQIGVTTTFRKHTSSPKRTIFGIFVGLKSWILFAIFVSYLRRGHIVIFSYFGGVKRCRIIESLVGIGPN